MVSCFAQRTTFEDDYEEELTRTTNGESCLMTSFIILALQQNLLDFYDNQIKESEINELTRNVIRMGVVKNSEKLFAPKPDDFKLV